MKIKFQRTGGFANIPVNVELDTATLAADAGNRLTELVAQVFPFNPVAAEPMPDACNYDLTVEQDGAVQELHVNDTQLTDSLQDLFDLLLE
jgi:hypothetical protein